MFFKSFTGLSVKQFDDHYKEIESKQEQIPNLEVYIIDVWPWMEKGNYPVSLDYDSLVNRKNELTYQDKTPYDEKVANIITDYHDLSTRLLELTKDRGATKEEINKILEKTGISTHRSGKKRPYQSLLEDRFDITKLICIERSGDPNDIANKWYNFSQNTIEGLIDQGIKDALITLKRLTDPEI